MVRTLGGTLPCLQMNMNHVFALNSAFWELPYVEEREEDEKSWHFSTSQVLLLTLADSADSADSCILMHGTMAMEECVESCR